MWRGNYRVYMWYNGLDHNKLVSQDESVSDDAKRRNIGFGLSFDQSITDKFGVFSRFGWQRPDIGMAGTNPNTAPCEFSWSGGVQVSGQCWKRTEDVLAVGVGQVIPSEKYKDAGNGGASETHVEAYYRFQVTKNLSISPDLQIIWDPRGISESYQGDNDTIFVYGVRSQLDF